jgi:acyl carrier protein
VSKSIEQGIIEIIADIAGVEPGDIKTETNFAKDLEIDSIKAIEITVAIEKKFKVSVRDEDVPNILNLRQAVELVTTLVEKKG